MLTLALQERGLKTVYLSEPLTEGLHLKEAQGICDAARALVPGLDADCPLQPGSTISQQTAPARDRWSVIN